jgi:RNA polymerase sigma-70 factor (ECF subfamily)
VDGTDGGQPDLVAALADLHPAAFAWALCCCGRDRTMADDVLQTSYLKILDGRARFRGAGTFKAFLFGVVRTTAAESRRRGLARRLLLARWGSERPAPPPAADPEREAARAERHGALRAALGRLPRRQRELLELLLAHDLTLEEAARTLGISVGSARVHYARAKRRLGRELGR